MNKQKIKKQKMAEGFKKAAKDLKIIQMTEGGLEDMLLFSKNSAKSPMNN